MIDEKTNVVVNIGNHHEDGESLQRLSKCWSGGSGGRGAKGSSPELVAGVLKNKGHLKALDRRYCLIYIRTMASGTFIDADAAGFDDRSAAENRILDYYLSRDEEHRDSMGWELERILVNRKPAEIVMKISIRE